VAGAKYNYQDAPPDILARVARIEHVCQAHGVALPDAALHFALGHPAVASVVLGAQNPQEVERKRGRSFQGGAGGAVGRSEGRASARCQRAGAGVMRIDAHHHLWTLARRDYGWLTPALQPIYRDFALLDLAPHLDAAGIEGTILVQAAPTEAETMFLLEIAEGAEVVRGVVGWIDFDAADGVTRIEALAVRELLVGLRPMVQNIADDDWLLRPALAPLLRAMARHHLVFDALVLPRHLPRLLQVIDRHPDLTFVLDHFGKPRLATGEDCRLAARCRAAGRTAEHRLQDLRPRHRSQARLADRGSAPGSGSCARLFWTAAHDVGKRLAGAQSGGRLCAVAGRGGDVAGGFVGG